MTKNAYSRNTSREQNRYLHKHLIKARSMKLCTFTSGLQKPNTYFREFPSDTGGKTTPFPTDEIIDTIYHSITTT